MRRKKGFTLIEFMVAAVIFSLFTYTLYNLFAGGLRAYKKGETITLLKKNASQFLDWVSTDIHAGIENNVSVTGGSVLTIGRYIKGSSTGIGDLHTITYTYNASDGTITRDDAPTTTTYTEEGDITFGGEENVYFYSTSGAPFSYDSTTETLTVDFYTQSGKTYDNQTWKRLRLVNTYAIRIQGNAFAPGTDSNYATKVFDGNDAIEDPGSPSDRITFMK